MDERETLLKKAFEDFLEAFPPLYVDTADLIRDSGHEEVGGVIRKAFYEAVGKLADSLSSYPRG